VDVAHRLAGRGGYRGREHGEPLDRMRGALHIHLSPTPARIRFEVWTSGARFLGILVAKWVVFSGVPAENGRREKVVDGVLARGEEKNEWITLPK
jgi:hypothetical protein